MRDHHDSESWNQEASMALTESSRLLPQGECREYAPGIESSQILKTLLQRHAFSHKATAPKIFHVVPAIV